MSPLPKQAPATTRSSVTKATGDLTSALRRHSRRAVSYHTQNRTVVAGEVLSPGPDWAIDLYDSALLLTGAQISVGQWVERYHAETGVAAGDTAILLAIGEGDYVLIEVVSDTSADLTVIDGGTA